MAGQLAAATLLACARGEISIETAVEQAFPHRKELHNRARADLARARELYVERRGQALTEGQKILADLLTAAGVPPREEC